MECKEESDILFINMAVELGITKPWRTMGVTMQQTSLLRTGV